MRAPSPVQVTCTAGRYWGAAPAVLAAASVAVSVAWLLPHLAFGWGGWLPDPLPVLAAHPAVQAGLALWAGAMAGAGAWLAGRAARTRERTLRWDGQDWILPGERPGEPELRGAAALMLDLGPWMLVRFVPHAGVGTGRATWLPLHPGDDLARWAALRSALWTWCGPAR
jgi:hypothetical protein